MPRRELYKTKDKTRWKTYYFHMGCVFLKQYNGWAIMEIDKEKLVIAGLVVLIVAVALIYSFMSGPTGAAVLITP